MLNKFHRLRSNSNILIAIESLLHGKDIFITTFLLTYLARLNASQNPIGFSFYEIIRYALMSFFGILLVRIIRKHKLLCYRLGLLFSVAQIALIASLGGRINDFIVVLAIINGLGSALFWRPNAFFSITEVPNSHRVGFETKKVILSSVIKVASPIILGVIIADTSYTATANIVLVISIAQLVLSLFLRPTAELQLHKKSLGIVKTFRQIRHLKNIRRLMLLQFLRGALVSGSAIFAVLTIITNNAFHSDADLGVFTTCAAIISTAMLLLYNNQSFKNSKYHRFVNAMCPILAVLPIILLVLHQNPTTIAICYVVAHALLHTFLNMVCVIKEHNILSGETKIHKHIFETEAIMEVFLCLGRVTTFAVLILFSLQFDTDKLPLLTLGYTLLAIPLSVMLYRIRSTSHQH